MVKSNNRYLYQDHDGRVHGPFWLSAMREHWKRGRFTMSTQISIEGTNEWTLLEFHPEVFEEEATMPAIRRMAKSPSSPSRLLAWMIVLLIAFLVYQFIQNSKPVEKKSVPAAAIPAK